MGKKIRTAKISEFAFLCSWQKNSKGLQQLPCSQGHSKSSDVVRTMDKVAFSGEHRFMENAQGFISHPVR
jgi:hypothetical protein